MNVKVSKAIALTVPTWMGGLAVAAARATRPSLIVIALLGAFGFSANSAYAMVINVSYDASVSVAPAGFKSGFRDAVNFFRKSFNSPTTVNLNVGYGEENNTILRPGVLGASQSYMSFWGYSDVLNALASDRVPGSQYLPASDPYGQMAMTTAESKALGLAPANGSNTDGYVGFSSSLPFSFDPTTGVAPGTYDFVGVAEHEISEVLGRMALTGSTLGGVPNVYSVQDLYRYGSLGTLLGSNTSPTYFSVDGGATVINYYNLLSGGDAGDWAASAGNDAFDAFANSGVVLPFTAGDYTMMQALGYNRVGTIPQPAMEQLAQQSILAYSSLKTVPDPSSFALLVPGLAGLGFFRCRKRAS